MPGAKNTSNRVITLYMDSLLDKEKVSDHKNFIASLYLTYGNYPMHKGVNDCSIFSDLKE